jgi:hypothetical protein
MFKRFLHGIRYEVSGVCLLMLAASASPLAAQSGPSAEELKRANNPLANMKALNFQNYYTPALYGLPDDITNTFWIRYAQPVGRVLIRASLPLNTLPSGQTDPKSGVGDFNIFATYLATPETAATQFGIGPLLAAPTASDDVLGSGKWQAGAAIVVFSAPSTQIQFGGLVTVQASFAGDDDRADTGLLVLQPFAMWQLGKGTYLRSAPLWVFNLESGDYNVPFGLGVGKVVKVGNTVFNIFLEPQFTMLHEGVGQPAFQLFTGLNLQFVSD